MIVSSSATWVDLPYGLFELARRLQVVTPEYDKINEAFYSDTVLSIAQVHQLSRETEEIRRRYVREAKEKIGREKHVHAKDPAVRDSILEGLIQNDEWVLKLDEMGAVCREAIATSRPIHCSGD